MVHDQLRQLLLEHDCVTLPGFGALLAEPVPARIHPVRHTLSPPARRVAFSDRLRHDDGLLTEAVRRSLPVPEAPSAPVRVTSFTDELRAALRLHRAAELRGLGTLRQPVDGDAIRFEALEPGYLPLADSFGLPELAARPVVLAERTRATRYVPETTANPPRRVAAPARLRRLIGGSGEPLYRLATAAIVVLSLSATYFGFRVSPLAERYLPGAAIVTSAQPEPQRAAVGTPESEAAPAGNGEKSVPAPDALPAVTLAPAAESIRPRPETPPIASVATVATSATVRPTPPPAAPAPAPESASIPSASIPAASAAAAAVSVIRKAPTNRYYLIWNAFTTPAKAERGRGQVQALTPPDAANVPTILNPPRGSALYRVAIADFATEAEAQAAKPALKARYGPALWVLRY